MSTEWFILRANGAVGPYTGDALKALAADGKIGQSDLIRKGRDGKSFPASSVKGLFQRENSVATGSTEPRLSPAAPDTTLEWYYGKDGNRLGPVRWSRLRSLADARRLAPSDLVWREGFSGWVPAAQIEGLFVSTEKIAAAIKVPPPIPSKVHVARQNASPNQLADRSEPFFVPTKGRGLGRFLPSAVLPKLSNPGYAIGLTVLIFLLLVLVRNSSFSAAVSFGLAFVIYFDAAANKIGVVAPRKWFSANMSAGMWATMTVLLWPFILPAYLLNRPHLIQGAMKNPQTSGAMKLKLGVLGALAALFLLASFGQSDNGLSNPPVGQANLSGAVAGRAAQAQQRAIGGIPAPANGANAPVETKKWGYIEKAGKIVIPFQFEEAGRFSEGLAAAKKEGRWGYIDPKGNVAIAFQYTSADDFSQGVAFVIQDKTRLCIDRNAKTVFQLAAGLRVSQGFTDGRAVVANDDAKVEDGKIVDGTGLQGLIDREGKIAVRPQFRMIARFSEERAVVVTDTREAGTWEGLIDPDGNYVVPLSKNLHFDSQVGYRDGLIPFKRSVKHAAGLAGETGGFMNRDGHVVMNCPHGILPVTDSAADFRISGFSDGLAAFVRMMSAAERRGNLLRVERGLPANMPEGFTQCGYLDRSGSVVIQPQFDWPFGLSAFSEGVAAVKKGDKWGYIDKTGHFVIEPRFYSATLFKDGLARVEVEQAYFVGGKRIDEKYGMIDHNGGFVAKTYPNMVDFSVGLAAVQEPSR
jgi:hypothetical protein